MPFCPKCHRQGREKGSEPELHSTCGWCLKCCQCKRCPSCERAARPFDFCVFCPGCVKCCLCRCENCSRPIRAREDFCIHCLKPEFSPRELKFAAQAAQEVSSNCLHVYSAFVMIAAGLFPELAAAGPGRELLCLVVEYLLTLPSSSDLRLPAAESGPSPSVSYFASWCHHGEGRDCILQFSSVDGWGWELVPKTFALAHWDRAGCDMQLGRRTELGMGMGKSYQPQIINLPRSNVSFFERRLVYQEIFRIPPRFRTLKAFQPWAFEALAEIQARSDLNAGARARDQRYMYIAEAERAKYCYCDEDSMPAGGCSYCGACSKCCDCRRCFRCNEVNVSLDVCRVCQRCYGCCYCLCANCPNAAVPRRKFCAMCLEIGKLSHNHQTQILETLQQRSPRRCPHAMRAVRGLATSFLQSFLRDQVAAAPPERVLSLIAQYLIPTYEFEGGFDGTNSIIRIEASICHHNSGGCELRLNHYHRKLGLWMFVQETYYAARLDSPLHKRRLAIPREFREAQHKVTPFLVLGETEADPDPDPDPEAIALHLEFEAIHYAVGIPLIPLPDWKTNGTKRKMNGNEIS